MLNFHNMLNICICILHHNRHDQNCWRTINTSRPHLLRLLIDTGFFQILQFCVGVFLPQFFEAVDLLCGDLARAKLFSIWRHFHQPRQELTVLNQWLPLCRVPVHVLPCISTQSHCWLGGRNSIWPVKNWVMRCWCGYLSGAKCRWFAYGPADATSTHHLLLH